MFTTPLNQPLLPDPIKWQTDELYDLLAEHDIRMAWEACLLEENLQNIINLRSYHFNINCPQPRAMHFINLKTKLFKTIPVATKNSAKADKDGRIILVSNDGKTLQVCDMEKKIRLISVQTDQEFHFADWHDGESILYVEGDSLCRLKLVDSFKEIIMNDIPVEFRTNIHSIMYNNQFYVISVLSQGVNSYLVYSPEKQVRQLLSSGTCVGMCLLPDSIYCVATTSKILVSKSDESKTSIPYNFTEKAYMAHGFKDSQLIIFVGYMGDCVIFDISSQKVIACDHFKTAIASSYIVDDSLVILTKEGKIIQYNIDPSFMLQLYRMNYDVSLEVIKYWKQKLEKGNEDVILSSISTIRPLTVPLGKYKRDNYELHGGIYLFHPIISYYFPYMYQNVIRNECNIDFSIDEQNIIKDFISYLIYGGKNLMIDRENFLQWMLVFDRCWFEFTELEASMVKLFNSEVESFTPDFAPLLKKLEEFHVRNYNFEGGLLQKCINFCKDAILRKRVLLEPSQLEHVPITLSLEFLYGLQDSYDVTLVAFGKHIMAHKTVLSTYSPMLEVMLDEEGSFQSEINSNQELILEGGEDESSLEKDRKGDLFNSLVRFCYTGEIDCTYEDAFLLFEIADQYQINCAKTHLVHKITEQLAMDNFLEILQWSELFLPISNKELHGKLLAFGKSNGKLLLERYSEQLSSFPEFLIRLLKIIYCVE